MIGYEEKIRKLQRRKVIYVVAASFLIILNLVIDFISLMEGEFYRNFNNQDYSIGYFIGSQFFIIFGLFLFYRTYWIGKRIEWLRKEQLENMIDEVGTDVVKE